MSQSVIVGKNLEGMAALHTNHFHKILTITCIVCMLGGAIVGILVPAGLGWDFANFYDAGRRVSAGQIKDLYSAGVSIRGESPQGKLGFYGTPISAYLYVPLSVFQAETALVLFKIENTIALFFALWLLYCQYRRFEADRKISATAFAALFTLLCLIYQPFWSPYRVGGQTTSTVLLLLVLASSAHTRLKVFQSALLCVSAVLIKPGLLTMLLFLMISSGKKYFYHVMAIGSAFIVLSIGLMGWEIHVLFVRQMISAFQGSYPWYWNSSLYVSFENLRAIGSSESFWRSISPFFVNAIRLVVIVVFLRLMIRSRSGNWAAGARRHFEFLMSVGFFLLVTLTVWEHYLAFLFLLLIYVVSRSSLFEGGPLVIVRSIFFFCLFQNIVFTDLIRARFDVESVFGLFMIGLFKSTPLLLMLLFLWKYDRELYRSYAAMPSEKLERL